MAELKLHNLISEAHKFSDKFSYEVGHVLNSLIWFHSAYRPEVPKPILDFIYSTLSVFWRVTDQLGTLSRRDESTVARCGGSIAPSERPLLTPYGRMFPLRDILLQMDGLFRILSLEPPLDLGKNPVLMREILLELCRCVAKLEENIERYRGT